MRKSVLVYIVAVASVAQAGVNDTRAAQVRELAQAEDLFKPPAGPMKHRFGVDWQEIHQAPEAIRIPQKLDILVNKWIDFPDQASNAIWHGAAAGAAVNVLLGFLVILIVYQIATRK